MPERASWTRLRRRPEAWLLLVIVIVGAVFGVTARGFLTLPNVFDLLETYSVQAIIAMGLFVVLVSGGIDISFLATASVAQYCAALLAARVGLPAPVVIAAGLAIGAALGCVNAALIHHLRITSIIATISMMSVSFSLLMFFSGGRSIYDLPDWWTTRVVFYRTELASGDIVRVTLPIVAMAVVAFVTWLLMTRASIGRQIYAMGGNPEAARRIGANIGRLTFFAYGYLGILAALGGMMQAHRVGESVPNALVNNELAILSAAVLGGASLSGGIGTVPGVLLGIVLLAILQNGLNLLGVSAYFFRSSSASPSSSRPRSRSSARAGDGGTGFSGGRRRMADTPQLPGEREGLLRLTRGIPGGHLGLIGLLAALLVLFAVLVPGFLSAATLNSFMYQLPLLGLLSLAMVVPLLTGGLNLAIIATTNQCALAMVFVMRVLLTPESGAGTVAGVVALALVAGLALCVLIGLVTGALVAYTGVHPILVTLGTKSLIDGISIYLTRGMALSGVPEPFSATLNATILGAPLIFVTLIVAAGVVGVILRHTPFGIACAMIGSNPEATRYSSIDTRRVLVGVYTMSSVICFFAALVMLATFNSASADYAQSYLLVTSSPPCSAGSIRSAASGRSRD